jgi:hypothetical protein
MEKHIYYVKASLIGLPSEYYDYLVIAESVVEAKNVVKDKFSAPDNYNWSAWAVTTVEYLQEQGYAQI